MCRASYFVIMSTPTATPTVNFCFYHSQISAPIYAGSCSNAEHVGYWPANINYAAVQSSYLVYTTCTTKKMLRKNCYPFTTKQTLHTANSAAHTGGCTCFWATIMQPQMSASAVDRHVIAERKGVVVLECTHLAVVCAFAPLLHNQECIKAVQMHCCYNCHREKQVLIQSAQQQCATRGHALSQECYIVIKVSVSPGARRCRVTVRKCTVLWL